MPTLRMVIPKGRLYDGVVRLLQEAGVGVERDERVYVPRVSDPEIEAKLLKPQNIPRLIELGAHDIGFCGFDWVRETRADVIEVMDLGLDPVRIVAAAPVDFAEEQARRKKLVAASEYENLTREFLDSARYDYIYLRSYGATEVFPPDDADLIVDNAASGRTLQRNGLRILAVLLESSTRLIAHPAALEDPWKREKIGRLRLLLQAVLDARERVMLEMNVPAAGFPEVVAVLPCMRAPTVAPLHDGQGFSVKAAVPRRRVAELVPRLKELGARDILEYELRKVVVG